FFSIPAAFFSVLPAFSSSSSILSISASLRRADTPFRFLLFASSRKTLKDKDSYFSLVISLSSYLPKIFSWDYLSKFIDRNRLFHSRTRNYITVPFSAPDPGYF